MPARAASRTRRRDVAKDSRQVLVIVVAVVLLVAMAPVALAAGMVEY
jgi:hypothetical protein